MKPLVCFYRDTFIKSSDYTLMSCADSESVADFLDRIATNYAQPLKIVQVGFEFDNGELFSHQKKLYQSAKASVFILNSFEEISALPDFSMPPLQFESLESEAGFIKKVERIRADIAEGRVYQVNLTAPLKAACDNSALEIFSHYSKFFSGPYRALLPLEHADIISFSPELFLEKSKDRLCTRPIKGSLPAGIDFSQLLENKKEEAELSMIVDLLRNDLNRIEENGSAVVTRHRSRMQLGYIQHTYSEVEIKTEKSLSKILNCTLPGGSISGCPKNESLKMIAAFEPYARQAYTGCLGWWEEAEFCLNLSIRSFIKSGRELFYHAGCGIVFDSDPQKEWSEFLLKTGSLNVR